MERESLFVRDGRGEDSSAMSMGDRPSASFLACSQEIAQALEVLDEAWEACLDRDIPLDAIVAGSLLRVLNELAVEGGRSAVSLLLKALLRDIDRGDGQSSFLSVYDGAA
ncbi:MAG: hypothetical protein EBU54_11630, partial [Mycobacteriaceae bacterium]|nr:hypothetical protein [Mycobacteriaceae bacterium]